MLPTFLSLRNIPLLAICISFVVVPCIHAQEEDDGPAPVFSTGSKPFVYVMAASANRLKTEATYMFDVAGMPDAVDAIMTRLEDNVQGLDGLDWERPAGMMMYLNSVFPPSFEFVSFLPISSEEQFQSMMELGTVVMRKEPNEEGRYELITPRRNIQIRIHNGYAFIQMPWMDPDPTFDRELPNPGALVAGLANQFDVSITLDVEAVPKATRDLLLTFLNSTVSTQIQQRDDEPESRYLIRKNWMQADLDAYKLLFDECKKMSFGLNVDSQERCANIDMVMDVKDGGELLEEILASSTKTSYFTPILSESSPVSICWSGLMAQRDRDRYAGFFDSAKAEAARLIEENELGNVPDEASPLFAALSGLAETAREGHFDLFGQFYNDADGKLAIVAGLRVQDGEAIASGLDDLLLRIRDKQEIGELTIAANEHAGVTFHRLHFKNPDAGAIEIFGQDPGVTAGCSPRTLWVCVGGEESFDTLAGTMDELVEAYENPAEQTTPAAMRIIVKVNELIELGKAAGAANAKERAEKKAAEEQEAAVADAKATSEAKPGKKTTDPDMERRQRWQKRRAERNQMFQEALAEGDDRIQLDVRPTDKGMRMRAKFEEGFVRGVGRMIGSRFIED